MEAVDNTSVWSFARNGLWFMTANRRRSLVKRVLVLLLFTALFGCLGSLETASGDQALLTLRQQTIMQYTRQGRLDSVTREKIFAAADATALQALISKLDDAHLNTLPVDGRVCMEKLKEMVALGKRFSGSPGMDQQRKMLMKYFKGLGATVVQQSFNARNPLTRQPVESVKMTNLIVQWHPERQNRVLICAHYDTRPFPDNDPLVANRKGLFVGANDGASGVAVLCGLAPHMGKLEGKFGVDFVLFDGEELVYDNDRDPFFLGSTHFAREYASLPPTYRYSAGILLDMVGDANLQIYQEMNSRRFAPQLIQQFCATARRINVK